MSEYTGRKVSFGIAREAVRGVAETTVDYWLNHMSVGFYSRAEKATNESALGNLHKGNDSTTMVQYAEGDFEMKAGEQSIGLLFLAALGAVSTGDNADANAAVKDHTFTVDQSNSPQSLTIFRKDPNVNEAYPLGMLSSFELNSELGGWLMASGTFLSKKAEASAVTVTRINEVEFKPKHQSVRLAANTAGLGAAADIATIQSLKLTIDRSTERDHSFGSEDPYDISVREIEITGELVLRHVDDTYKAQFLNDTQQAMRISVVNSDVTIGAAAHPGFVIDLDKVSFNNWEIDQGLGDKVDQTISFTALYDFTNAKAIQIVLTNTVSSYTA